MDQLPPEDQPDVFLVGPIGPIPIVEADDPRCTLAHHAAPSIGTCFLCRSRHGAVTRVSRVLLRPPHAWSRPGMRGIANESAVLTIWFFGCLIGGPIFVAGGARAGGLALVGAVVGAFIGTFGAAQPEQLPQRAMVGATIGAFAGGLVGLMWRSSATARRLRVLGRATLAVGVVCVLAGWIGSGQVCGRNSCLPDVDVGALTLFALDAGWIAALCFIQAAQSNRASSPTVGAHEFPESPAS